MKKIIYATFGLAAILASSCKKEATPKITDLNGKLGTSELVTGAGVDTLKGSITVNTTVTRKTILKGLVYVNAGVTLTINPGVTIVGSAGPVVPDTVNLENNKGTLLVQRGARLVANGTAGSPIIWTSSQSAGSRQFGDWGGVVIYGRAPIHRANGATNGLFEAFDFKPDNRNRYGYGDAAFPTANIHDNSGSITYNRFEFGGGVIYQVNKEVNGFTMCGVGDGTIFHHNEILESGDDGIEFFGGTVDVHHIFVYNPHDDAFDFDEGYQGHLQFIVAVQNGNADNSGSHLFEIDNDASATNFLPRTNPIITNATLVGPQVAKGFGTSPNSYYDGAIQVRRNARLKLFNSNIIAWQQPSFIAASPTTRPVVAQIPSIADSIVLAVNLIQSSSATPTVTSAIEGNPVPLATAQDAGLNAIIFKTSVTGNVKLTSFTSFNLSSTLQNTATSPSISGGVDLNARGLTMFVGTTQRGAVLSTDNWLYSPWVSIAAN